MTPAVIALGANLGDRLANLQAAVRALEAGGVAIERLSSVWETEPIPPGQPTFLNAVLVAGTPLAPLPLLALLKEIEERLGRGVGLRWGPRPIDLDILFYGDEQLESEALTIPHPRIAGRNFVLAPLAEVLPGPLPVLGGSAAELLNRTGRKGLVLREDLQLTR